MKNTLFISVIITSCLFAGCMSDNSRYAKAIENFNSIYKGVKYDINFKCLELQELKQITVSDSIRILTDSMENRRARMIRYYEKSIKSNQALIDSFSNSKPFGSIMVGLYTTTLQAEEKRLAEEKNWNPGWVDRYNSRNPKDVLGILVRCKYSATMPFVQTKVEIDEFYILDPNGEKCIASRSKVDDIL